jgi:hypothetical protein
MTWRKLGLLDIDTRGAAFAASHLALPAMEPRPDGRLRLFVTVRNAAGKSHIATASLEPRGGSFRGTLDPEPALAPGSLGAFDDAGVTMSCVVRDGDRVFLYYTGWSLGVSVPFYWQSGLAVSTDGGRSFARVSRGPIMERNDTDPYLNASPWVMVDGGVWRMWYLSATKWTPGEGGPKHYYHVRYAESRDGVHWHRDGRVCVDFGSADEYAFGRPCVMRDADGTYRMWYSVRGAAYRIGYAESSDGLAWTRMDDRVGIDVSPEGFDSDMIEYGVVFDHGGRRLMLYNGNDYGRSGIGLAEQC